MKSFKFNVVNEVVIIYLDGSTKSFDLVLDFSFCSNYYTLENFMI